MSLRFFSARPLPTVALVLVASLPSYAAGQVTQPSPSSPTVPAGRTAAQDAAAAAGRTMTNAEIADAIKKSGLSEDQVRERVRAAGYDPKLADPFFATGDQAAGASTANASFVSALQQMGILQAADQAEELDADKANRASALHAKGSMSLVFGKSVFNAKATEFDPVTSGPVDPSYRIGTGDQLQVILTGDVERAYTLEIRRDGTIVLPQVGQINVAGLTLDAAGSLLRARAARYFSGLDNGRTRLDLSVGRLRSIEVYVVGEVESPGAYQVSALGTMFHALARAGGPTNHGSFRSIELRRGNRVVGHFDLYDYLLTGDASTDTRLQQGDVIFVPMNTRAVAFTGAVRRPGIYELKQEESFSDLLRFTGGLLPNAASDRLQIDRILPASERTPGRERVVVDVRTNGDLKSLDTLRLHENDVVSAFVIGDLRRNTVDISGELFQPGRFEWRPGLTLGQLVQMAQGTAPWALTDRVKVVRAVPATGRKEIFSLDLSDSAAARFPIQEFDEVTVLDGRLEYPAGSILVEGAVNKAGKRPFVERVTLRDAIDLAGGFSEHASRIEVARQVVRPGYTDTTSVIFRFPLTATRELNAQDARFPLQRGDEVSVRSTPGSREFGTVTVRGLFNYPGSYAIQRDDERLKEIVQRAGGVLPTASHETFKVVRTGRTVAVDFDALMKGDPQANIAVREDDEIIIANDPSVVFVTGAVERRVAVPFHRNWSLEDYLDAAGGVAPNGVRDKVIVEYAGGAIARTSNSFFSPRRDPPVRPGATITVSEKPPEKEGAFRDTLVATGQIVSVLASIAIAIAALHR